VGHFIYGLQDRIWPDFVCHFSLYRGVQSHVKGFVLPNFEAWSSHDHNIEVAQRSSFNLRPSLHVLANSAATDLGSSDHELAKFGFSYRPKHIVDEPIKELDQPFGSVHIGSTNISIGQFCFDIPLDQGNGSSSFGELPKKIGQCAKISKIQCPPEADPPKKGLATEKVTTSPADFSTYAWCYSVPGTTLLHLEDLRLANYSEQDIMEILNVPSIPPMELTFKILGYCSRCCLLDHQLKDCPGPCDSCAYLGKACSICASNRAVQKPDCSKCLGVGHDTFKCQMGWRCRKCLKLGHRARACEDNSKMVCRVKQCTSSMEKRSSRLPKQVWVKKVISQQPSIQSNLDTLTAREYLGVIDTCHSKPLLDPTCAASSSFSFPYVPPPTFTSTVLPQEWMTMATVPVNLLAFLLEGMTVDHGPADRKIRTDLVVPAFAPLQNDKVTIAETSRFVPIQLREEMRLAVQGMLQEPGFVVRAVDDHRLD
jgi:hypothetical protein